MKEIKKILVVDDDPGIGEMLKTLLEMHGYQVSLTANPAETQSILGKDKVNLVLLDKLISGISGTEICSFIKNNEQTAGIPVLMMSALHDAGPLCKEAGADDFIAKPFEMDDLLAKVEQLSSN